ncbi:bifunctional nicotinamidase/pyrazinamidase [Hymenobacter rubripertinctus]|uniref:Nicotinamidase n=1 Tax=Hymenobacter rubripertinctus TaxID=2029981 RepID=A0A418QVQ5_9BACT|nr:bifunctional nicotinamidase/pyrazinamidase [Hymenobacter rubripertinctus]RIY09224.1 bifunctional nicotinamidase/pyrazinamidase [Hymenobacter rubripertinctus]
MNALLLIDIQNDFMPGGTLAVPEGDAILPLVNRLQPQFELVVATQDWHPAGHGSFASQHPGCRPFEQGELHGLPQTLWPDHCVQGSTGAELHPALSQHRLEAIFRKGTDPAIDSYSAFFDNGHRKSTGLADYLRGRGVRRVYLAGLAADYCVYFSAKDALGKGFGVFFVEDATRAISAEGYQQARHDLAQRGARFITAAQVP